MKWTDIIKISIASSLRNKKRSLVAALSVTVSLAALSTAFCINAGIEEEKDRLLAQNNNLNLITVLAKTDDAAQNSLLIGDYELELINATEHVSASTPIYRFPLAISLGGDNISSQVVALNYDFLAAMNFDIVRGEIENTASAFSFVFDRSFGQGLDDSNQEDGSVEVLNKPLFGSFAGENNQSIARPIQVAAVLETGSDANLVFANLNSIELALLTVFPAHDPLHNNGFYSEAWVLVDEIEHVNEVESSLQHLGFETSSHYDQIILQQDYFKDLKFMLLSLGMLVAVVSIICISTTMLFSTESRKKGTGRYSNIGREH